MQNVQVERGLQNGKSLMVDVINQGTVWSSASFFGPSATYKSAPLAGPFAVAFDSIDPVSGFASIRLCFLVGEADDATKTCRSQTNSPAIMGSLEQFQTSVNDNIYTISWMGNRGATSRITAL